MKMFSSQNTLTDKGLTTPNYAGEPNGMATNAGTIEEETGMQPLESRRTLIESNSKGGSSGAERESDNDGPIIEMQTIQNGTDANAEDGQFIEVPEEERC